MNTLIVSYDLRKPETSADYKILIEYLETFPGWAKPLESFWIIRTAKTATQVRDEINNVTDSNDKILVLDVTIHSAAARNIGDKIFDWFETDLALRRA